MSLLALIVLPQLGGLMAVAGFVALLALWATPFRLYKISSAETSSLMKTAVFHSCTYSDSFIGIALGRWFVAYSTLGSANGGQGDSGSIYVIMTAAARETLRMGGRQSEVSNMVSISMRRGSLWNYEDNTIAVSLPTSEPWDDQKNAVDGIADIYAKRGNAVALLTGPPGVGKSKVSAYLAKRVNANNIVLKVNLTRPVEDILSLKSIYKPTRDKPVILMIDEVDIILAALHRETISQHKHLVCGMLNLADWNSSLDLFEWGDTLEGIILIMTSNMTPAQIATNYNPSCIRPGRVHYRQEFSNSKCK